MNTERSQGGLSLLELLICLLVIAILASFGGANLSLLIQRQQASSTMLDLRRLLNYARYTAIMERRTVTMCAIDESGKCNKRWKNRRTLVFVDANSNRRFDDGESVLREEKWALSTAQVTWRASLGRGYIQFNRDGGTAQNGTFIYCPSDKNAALARAIIVNRAGRHYRGSDSNRDGIEENSQGRNLSCD